MSATRVEQQAECEVRSGEFASNYRDMKTNNQPKAYLHTEKTASDIRPARRVQLLLRKYFQRWIELSKFRAAN
jgi:hypothetical protein